MSRAQAWERLREPYDLLVIGGGITGAATLYEAARRGLRAALVERGDFASGTSSRSSKLVHGGLRYLKEGKLGLTRESVREREELLRDAPGLVEPVAFVMPHYRKRKPSRATLALGLALYDALAGTRRHGYLDAEQTLALVPALDPDALTGAHWYLDGTTDDARLVLRLLAEAEAAGAVALNYASAALLYGDDARVCGAAVTAPQGERVEVRARATISATGVFADELRAGLGAAPRLRPLRGSHLVLPAWRLPLARCIAFEHPHDGRPVFAYPWEGAVLAGTTDLDHDAPLDAEPAISPQETAYLVAALRFAFPSLRLDAQDALCAYAGIRPIADRHAADPSKASRDHLVWNERGLVTISGGKLTTFRPMAMDALAAAAPLLPPFERAARRVFERSPLPQGALRTAAQRRLAGRYGALAQQVVDAAAPGELACVEGTTTLWAELRWAARHEMVRHLDDLLLRRTRVGLLVARGGERHFGRVAEICEQELGWPAARWSQELDAYRERVACNYAVPDRARIPDFRGYL
ncbi:MAG TPA: glycerol-3-phosphate dehydrogenase/oxidase [Verrucomicrobiae bacterium]|nr:glycerol-3-phosphate dehydrogenase/oxidase [Verrucomicrobiae bacterium]